MRASSPRRERGASLVYFLVGVAAATCLAEPFSEGLTKELIAAHHFRPNSWPAWGAIQVLPKMYSFANRCWIGPAPLLEQGSRAAAEARFERESFWVNHYPARKARFDGGRYELPPNSARYVYIRSTYFGHTETTGLRVHVQPGELSFERRDDVK